MTRICNRLLVLLALLTVVTTVFWTSAPAAEKWSDDSSVYVGSGGVASPGNEPCTGEPDTPQGSPLPSPARSGAKSSSATGTSGDDVGLTLELVIRWVGWIWTAYSLGAWR